MKQLAGYVASYFVGIYKKSFFLISLILSVLIYFNYTLGLNDQLLSNESFLFRLGGFYAFYLLVFAGSYFLVHPRSRGGFTFIQNTQSLNHSRQREIGLYPLLILAPLIFAAKVAFRIDNIVLQWPLKALIVVIPVMLIGLFGGYEKPLFGLRVKNANLKPYFYLLLLMLPLVVAAGLTSDFQRVYPKLHLIGEDGKNWFNALIFELSYGIDFFTIELFFRGFLVLAFIKYAGMNAILPMAVFYCTIHFGKPLAECISSYFGGLILGAIVYNTRSIWGGLMVHLGIAWMMEIVGVII